MKPRFFANQIQFHEWLAKYHSSQKELLVGFQSGYGDEKSGRQARFRSFRILKASE